MKAVITFLEEEEEGLTCGCPFSYWQVIMAFSSSTLIFDLYYKNTPPISFLDGK
jgi:hypothetical protein